LPAICCASAKGPSFRIANVTNSLPAYSRFLLTDNADMGDLVWFPLYLADSEAAGNASSVCLGPDRVGPDVTICDVQFTKIALGKQQ
jgi:hypothetical protein